MHYIQQNWNKLLIIVASFICLILALTFTFDTNSQKLLDDSFNQAVVVFASAKALNAVISLAQGTYLDLPFLDLAIGEVLDPVNDLVEQFSLIVLAALTSLGIQKILISFVSSSSYNILLFIVVVIVNIWMFVSLKNTQKIRTITIKLAILLLFLRFAVPLMSYTNDWVYTHVVKAQYNIEQLNENILQVKEEVNNVTVNTIEEKKSQSLINKLSSAFDTQYFNDKIKEYEKAAEDSSKYIIELIIAFVFQTLFLPLIFLFVLYQFIKLIFSRRIE
jgi:hypothetical protein